MIRKLIQRFRHRRVSKREIRKLMRKLPVLGVPANADLEKLALMVKRHSFHVRDRRLYCRYLDGKMSRDDLAKYRQMLDDREVIVTNSLGTSFAADREIVTRAITSFRNMVGQ